MVQSVQRALRVLRELASDGPRLGVTALAERIGVSKATAHALLRTLESEGLVVQDSETGRYTLGPAVLELGNSYLEHHELRTRSITWADMLALRCGEAVWVSVFDGECKVIVVHHAFRPEGAVQILEVGVSIPWHTCAPGKAVAAFLSEPQRARLLAGQLPKLTGRTLVDPDQLATQLEGVRNRGYAFENEECTLGEAGIASPVFNRSGTVAGAIGLVGPVERLLAGEARSRFPLAVREVATSLSRELGAGRGTAWQTP
jgi:DNA-binding IclR family transcriptional regulator